MASTDIVISLNEMMSEEIKLMMVNVKSIMPANINWKAIMAMQKTQINKLKTSSCCILLTRFILFSNILHWLAVVSSQVLSVSHFLSTPVSGSQ
jgi:hypothetical protein|tara:strand:- start:691 stop:972 length:282 start_codon:yes stop_codon:yes gene_type:complete